MNVPQDALLNYCMLPVAVACGLVYAFRVILLFHRGVLSLGGIIACPILGAAFFWIFTSDSEGTGRAFIVPTMLAFFAHVFVAERYKVQGNPLYKMMLLLSPAIPIVLLYVLEKYMHYDLQFGIMQACVLLYLSMFVISYLMHIIKNRTFAIGRQCVYELAISSLVAFFLFPVFVLIFGFIYMTMFMVY